MNTSFTDAVRDAFAAPFLDGKKPRADLKAETPLKLAYGLLPTGLSYGQLNALALAVRHVAALDTSHPEKPLTAAQSKALAALLGEAGLPAPFRELLERARPQLHTRYDLQLLYGVLAATMEKLSTIASVSELVVRNDVARKPVTVKRPRGKLRG